LVFVLIVIYHHGKSATGGHYTIDILRQEQSEWLRIDDTQIDVVPESDVAVLSPEKCLDKDKSAYLLFYHRVPDAPATTSASTSAAVSSGVTAPRQVQQQRTRKPTPAPQKGKPSKI
jgi:ubiquitin carboxyl-terminal hydrolase 10